jgi:hypothetical protein
MGERDAIHADTGSRDGQQVVPSRRGRVARFAQLALALDDLLAAGSCLRLVSQSDASLPTQVRHALFSAMIVAYGRLFPHAGDEARGLPGSYEPEGQLRVPHLHLLGIRNLLRQHGESSARRVQVGPARGRSVDSHVAPGGRIIWLVRPDPLGPLDLQQVGALFQGLRTRVEAEAGQLLTDLFAGRPVPPGDVVLEDA